MTEREEELKEPQGITAALSAHSTFSLGSEDEGPQGGDHLKLVVAQPSHLLDAAGQDHPLGVHLLEGGGEESADGTESCCCPRLWPTLVVECVMQNGRHPCIVFQFEYATKRRPPSSCSRSSLIVSHLFEETASCTSQFPT